MSSSSNNPTAIVKRPNVLKTWRAMVHEKVPLLSPILYAATYIEDEKAGLGIIHEDLATFCINPDNLTITWSPKFAAANSVEENAFILAHESAHYLLNHIDRRMRMLKAEGESTFELDTWMVAEDMAVNNLVNQLTGWQPPKGGVQPNPEWAGMTTEDIYRELRKLTANRPKHKCGHCIHPDAGKGGTSSAGEMLKVQLEEAATKELQKLVDSGKLQPGNMPGELRDLALRHEPLKRPPNWKEMLRRYLTETNIDAKYLDPSTLYRRRLAIDGLCLPNLSSQPTVKKFVVSIDNSGSVSDEMFACLCGVIDSAAQVLGFQEIIVQHFTTQVMATERVTHIKGVQAIKRKADGGTALDDCDRLAKTHRGQFHIILTDGYVAWLRAYSLPTIIVRTVASTEAPVTAHNLIGSVVADAKEDFGT